MGVQAPRLKSVQCWHDWEVEMLLLSVYRGGQFCTNPQSSRRRGHLSLGF